MTLAIVQARLSSERFPGKSLALLHGKPLVQHVLERAGQIHGVERVILATPSEDLPAFLNAPWTDSVGDFSIFASYRIATNDVLGRFAAAASAYPKAKAIMRLTGDCPLLEPAICEDVLKLFIETPGCEYAWTDTALGEWPDGLDCEVFSASALAWAERSATDPYDREHCTPWLRRHVRCAKLTPRLGYVGGPKISVDTEADLDRVRGLMERAA